MRAFKLILSLICIGLLSCKDPSSVRRYSIKELLDAEGVSGNGASDAQYFPGLPTKSRLTALNASYDTGFVNGMMYCIMSKDSSKQFDGLRDLYAQCKNDQSKCEYLYNALKSINSACVGLGPNCTITKAYVPYLVHLCYVMGGYKV